MREKESIIYIVVISMVCFIWYIINLIIAHQYNMKKGDKVYIKYANGRTEEYYVEHKKSFMLMPNNFWIKYKIKNENDDILFLKVEQKPREKNEKWELIRKVNKKIYIQNKVKDRKEFFEKTIMKDRFFKNMMESEDFKKMYYKERLEEEEIQRAKEEEKELQIQKEKDIIGRFRKSQKDRYLLGEQFIININNNDEFEYYIIDRLERRNIKIEKKGKCTFDGEKIENDLARENKNIFEKIKTMDVKNKLLIILIIIWIIMIIAI